MLANGADVNERTSGGQTPLILATIFGHTHLISLLLDAGADPQVRDNLGLNAIDWAQRRGATEVIGVLSNGSSRPAKTSTTRPQTPPASSINSNDAEKSAAVSDEERSRRWIAGLKQRIAEQSQREVADSPNIFLPQHDSQPWLASTEREPQPEIPVDPSTPQPELPATPTEPQPEIPAPSPDPQHEAEPTQPEPESPTEPSGPEVEARTFTQELARISTEEPALDVAQEPARGSGRKRCPKCNAIYNSDLVSYCAHHIVPLVDVDEPDPPPIISQPQTTTPVLFWLIIIATLIASLVAGSYIAGLFKTPPPIQPTVTASPPPQRTVQKGTPVVDKQLEDKVSSLPNAEAPLKGQVAIPGTVVVRVTVARTGQVTKAQASGGDWLLRGAASEAAMKSTFAPEKLRRRTTEGTITYTFEP